MFVLPFVQKALGPLLFVAGTLAWGLDFSTGVDRALTLDRTLSDLRRAAQRAELAWQKRRWDLEAPRLEARTGDTVLGLDPGTSGSVSTTPSVGLTTADGTLWRAQTGLRASGSGTDFAPEIGGRVPLVRPTPGLAWDEATLGWARAREAVRDRILDVQKALVARLRALVRAQLAVAQANRTLDAARMERTRARQIDGVTEDSLATGAQDRAVRAGERDHRIAAHDVQRLTAEIALVAGLGPGEALEAPEKPPEAGAELPDPETSELVRRAREAARVTQLKALWDPASPSWSVPWALGLGITTDPQGQTVVEGRGRHGVSLASDDWKLDASVLWSTTTGPGLQLSVAWTPRIGDQNWDARTRSLLIEGAAQGVREALDLARRAREDLDLRRTDLRAASEETGQDLRSGASQVQVYEDARQKGLVSAAELRAVVGAYEDARAAADLANLDWQTWDLDRRALFDAAQEVSGEA